MLEPTEDRTAAIRNSFHAYKVQNTKFKTQVSKVQDTFTPVRCSLGMSGLTRSLGTVRLGERLSEP